MASRSVFGVFEYIAEQEQLYNDIHNANKQQPTAGRTSPTACYHANDGGVQGLLVDIGAVKPFTGGAFVKSQINDMERAGFKASWENLAVPQYMRGIWKGSQRASKICHLVGALHDGRLIGYSSPVLDEDPEHPEIASVPPLYGLEQLSGINGMFDSKSGRIICIPDGESVKWLAGTRILQCERTPSGHWLLGVGHWDKVSPDELARVREIRRSSY